MSSTRQPSNQSPTPPRSTARPLRDLDLHAGLDQVLDLHGRGQPRAQVEGDALDQTRVLAHQLAWITLLDLGIHRAGIHALSPTRSPLNCTSRSTKNSRRPSGPVGRGHLAIRSAICMKDCAARLAL